MTPNEQQRPTPAAFALLIVLVVALFGALFGLWRLLHTLGSVPAAAVITASATVLISVISLIYSKSWEQRRAIQEAQRDHKRSVYENFMNFWFRSLMAPQLGDDPPSEDEMQRFVADFAKQLILWGSDDFLARYAAFRSIGSDNAPEGEEASPAVIFGFEQLLYTIRKDLGHANKGLEPGDLLRVWINDVDTLLPVQPAQG